MKRSVEPADLESVLAALKKSGTKRTRDSMARYGIVAPKAYGVTVGTIRALAKRFGRDHQLCEALWQSGWYEARMIAAFMDEPARVTAAQMERWARDFDSWAICDTLCFGLFDRTPAWARTKTPASSNSSPAPTRPCTRPNATAATA
jgi:3-methyladenine DNA glycosylase AlkD